jgi:hypothetical protein
VYFVDASLGGIGLLSPMTSDAYTTIIPDGSFPLRPQYGMIVNRAETSIWVSGHSANISYIVKFNKVPGGTPLWQKDTTFTPSDPEGNPLDNTSVTLTGNIRGLALSPDESTLWVTNNQSDGSKDRIYALNATTGAPNSSDYVLNFVPAQLTPQTIAVTAGDANRNADTSYNIFVTGFRSVAGAISTANAVTVVAPPDNGSSDSTRSQPFDVVAGATAVTVTAGPTVSNLTDSSARITWTTDFRADSTVRFGTTAGAYTLGQVTNGATVTSHALDLKNLAPGTT